MTYTRIFTISLFLITSFLFGQNKLRSFKLTDSTFKKDSYLRTYSVIYQIGGCDLNDRSYQFLDSLADFLTKYKKIALQINRHDFKPKPTASMHTSECRAQAVANYLINKGISKDRLSTKGYNGTQPLVSQEQIDKAKTKEEEMNLTNFNLRVEFIITSIK